MPRRFSAPIPIYSALGRRERVDKDDVRHFIVRVVDGMPVGQKRDDLIHLVHLLAPPLPDHIYLRWRRLLVSWELSFRIRDIVQFMKNVVAVCQDAFAVDDQFMFYINPDLASDLFWVRQMLAEVKSVPDKADRMAGLGWLQEELYGWMEERIGRLYPDVNLSTVSDFIVGGTPTCWHSQPHGRIVLRGRRPKPGRRAATWATYVIAWLVGSETVAVQLWNNLVDAEFQWGDPSKPAYALSKYWDAKKRLVDDLRATGGQRIIPERVVFEPFPPLESDIVVPLEAFSQGLLGIDVERASRQLEVGIWGEGEPTDFPSLSPQPGPGQP